MMNRGVEQPAPNASDRQGRFLYWWLLLAIIFEYSRPGSFVPVIDAVKLNTIIPMVLLVVTFFAKGLRPSKEILGDPFAKLLLAYVGLVVLSLAYAEVTLYAYDRCILVITYLILFWLIARIVTTRRRLLGVFVALILSHVFLLAMNPDVVLDPTTRHYIQGASFLGDGNDFALSVCILIPFALDLAFSARSKWSRVLYFTVAALLLLAIIGTQSRGGTLGLLAVAAYLWWQSPHKIKSLLAIGVVASVAVFYAPDSYFTRMSTIANYEEDSSAQSRIDAWKGAMRMAADHPILGIGAGQFPTTYGARYRPAEIGGRYMTAHSMYFLTLGELGFTGLLIWLSLVFGNIIANMRAASRIGPVAPGGEAHALRRTLTMANASMIGFAVAGAFLSVSYYPHIFVLTGLLLSARALAAHVNTPVTQPVGRFARYGTAQMRG